MYHTKRETLSVPFVSLITENIRYLKRRLFPPILKAVCMRMIILYQRYLSKHTCMFRPTCSQYTLECINNHGAVIGILLGAFRILRCHPWTKGGYDPAPEVYFKKRWLL
ncbi:MAG: membrane protein insertion efficiency factor YidD [Clostridiales bacterium]|jgi:putative membrane protein insertion efficiency factor|nr:membrane protein insertion efficiency factor YidD [Clostridiales bacterium]